MGERRWTMERRRTDSGCLLCGTDECLCARSCKGRGADRREDRAEDRWRLEVQWAEGGKEEEASRGDPAREKEQGGKHQNAKIFP